MKKLALALVCLVSVAFFASCTPEGKPSIQIINEAGYVQDGDVVDLDTEVMFGFKVASSPETGKALSSLVVKIDGEVFANQDLTGMYSYSYTGYVTFSADLREIIDSKMITAVVTDAAGRISTATLTLDINEAVQALVPTEFEWVRVGSNPATGLESVGLKWTRNQKDVKAIIEPINSSAMLYIFTADKWASVETDIQKLALFTDNPTTADKFNGVSCYSTQDYDYVIGTYYNGTYNLIHVTKGIVDNNGSAGTTVTIKGERK